jgi:hypothetical protein
MKKATVSIELISFVQSHSLDQTIIIILETRLWKFQLWTSDNRVMRRMPPKLEVTCHQLTIVVWVLHAHCNILLNITTDYVETDVVLVRWLASGLLVCVDWRIL